MNLQNKQSWHRVCSKWIPPYGMAKLLKFEPSAIDTVAAHKSLSKISLKNLG